MLIKCPECGKTVSDRAPICPNCGVEVTGNIIKCSFCGELHLRDTFCPGCHQPLKGPVAPFKNEQFSEPKEEEEQSFQPEEEEIEQSRPSFESEEYEVKPEEYEDEPEDDDNEPEEDETDDTVVQQAVPVGESDEELAPRRHSKKSFGALIIAFLIAAIIMAGLLYVYHDAQLNNEAKQYAVAIKTEDPLILQEYLNNYGKVNAEHAAAIRQLLNTLTQKKVVTQESPKEQPAPDTDEQDWQTAIKANSSAAYAHYLELHENGKHKAEADAALHQLARTNSVSQAEENSAKAAVRAMLVAMNKHNAEALANTLAATVNYNGTDNQSPSVVADYMEHLYSSSDKLNWYLDQGAPTVTKSNGDVLTIDIPARLSQNLKSGANAQNLFAIHATVNAEGKITAVTFSKN